MMQWRAIRTGLLAACLQTVLSAGPKVEMVEVADGVRLEVLDWGGTGRPLVLLAGYLTAHAYEEFAPRLTGLGHVYGITRRGLGASSRPEGGYTARESAADVLRVIEKLGLEKPVLLGHSFGGQDLTTIAANSPEKIAGIVYLNSAEDPTLRMEDYGLKPGAPVPPVAPRVIPPTDMSSIAGYQQWQRQAHGVAFPAEELRQLYEVRADGSLGEYRVEKRVRDALFRGLQKPEYRKVKGPVLAFFSVPAGEENDPRSVVRKRHVSDLRAGVPHARIVEVPGGNFYVFLSHEEELIREIRDFLAGL